MSLLLCDVGGTHIRFALGGKGNTPFKTRVDQYASFQDAIIAYLHTQPETADDINAFYFAFSNRNEWTTDSDSLRSVMPVAAIRQVNDFEANAHGVIGADEQDFELLNEPSGEKISGASRLVVGVGTGLGFAYIVKDRNGSEIVQRTHGGHMLPAYALQFDDLYRFISDAKSGAIIYEDMLTGRGLFEIYRFLSQRNHLDIEYPDAVSLMREGKDNPVFTESLTIFYELLGLFAHQAVAFGYAYDGIYLTGGVIDKLMLAGLFRADKFMQGFAQNNVPIVVRDVRSTPLYWVRDEFVSLNGLLHLAHEDGFYA